MHEQALAMILFLDFDGVLHPEGVGEDLEFVHLENLEKVLREFPCVQVVISSSWRLSVSLDAMRQRFSEDIRARILGVTPHMPELKGQRGQRQRECELWLKSAFPGRYEFVAWLALDDRLDGFDIGCGNLVPVPYLHDGGAGLEEDILELLRQRIRLKLR